MRMAQLGKLAGIVLATVIGTLVLLGALGLLLSHIPGR